MVSKNNIQLKDRYATKQVPHYGIRKLSVGVASVLLSTTLYMGVTAHADTIAEANPQPTIDQPASMATGNATGSVQLKPTADQSESTTTNSPASETNASSKSVQTVSPEQPADTTDVQSASDQLESAAANSSTSENGANTQSASAVLPKQPANVVDTQPAAEVGAQPFMNLAVASDNNEVAPKRETVDSTWTVHYVNQADHKQELKDPTVITMQYTRTNTPQSDGTTQYGDWSYVPGSFKQTGTPITVKDSDNPVKQDNIDKNGENMDVFTITAMYPTVAGYEFHDGVNGTRLHDNLRNNERQADTMSGDFYAEYDVAKERSVAVKFVDDQSYDFETSDHKKQVGQAVIVTGRDGDTVDVKLTVPDKYQLADGQQLPTSYTFAKGSGDLTIHLVHKVVQREATIDVQLGLTTGVHFGNNGYDALAIPQTRWEQLDDELKDGLGGPGGIYNAMPLIEAGTLTGHVNYDLVDNEVLSFGNDWTSLNLDGHTYQLPNGDDVVNGITFDPETASGKKLKEEILKTYQVTHTDVDSDYVNRPWHGYLSVNATNNSDTYIHQLGLQAGLVGNEPNALAKATDDRAATSVEMSNKPIDLNFVQTYDVEFSEQDGQLRAKVGLPVGGIYVPYVEKTAATRTINVTTPDGKTTAVKQTATLTKQIDLGKDAHQDWTTGEWENYEVPAIPGYTASQSNVSKETVTGTTEDQTVNITYTANEHQISIEYVDNATGKILKTDHVSGKTGQTVSITPNIPDGWELVSGQSVPSEVTLGADGAPATVIKVQPQERSVAVKFVDDQSDERQVGKVIIVTGRDGGTVDLNLTVPDKYQLADGQQLPTAYTFKKGSGDLTIHLVHQVVQREAAIDVQLGLMTTVDNGVVDDGALTIAVTQNHWKQLDDYIKDSKNPNSDKVFPSVKVGTLTGHVNYDLANNKVVSFADDWTNLNLGGQTYQMPDGTEVVNGVSTGSVDSWGKSLKEQLLKYHPDTDPDYVNRPWHGYLSVNETNEIAPDFTSDNLQAGLVGDESNALAKATGDQAATVVKMANKTIDSNWLKDNFNDFEFSEQNGQLRADGFVPVVGVYIPYVEKTATRTIKVTAPDGKTTTVKQTATLAKQIDFGQDAHPDWTTGEWASYDVPTIPGYTASQSNVSKETVTGTTEDQTVNITYTANSQTTTVVYQTEDGTPVHTTTVNGKTGQTVKVSNEVPAGWHIVNGNVPNEITFGPNGTPKTVVTIAHSHETVTPDAPKTTSDKLPDNPGKTYPAGVSHDDLNKTVTGTIKVTMPDGQVKTALKTAHLTRTADVDEVTGEVTYSDWTTGYWSAYTAPSVPGYTANYPYIAGQSVGGETEDQTIEITYTANEHQISIEYVDNATGQVVKTDHMSGKTGQTVSITPHIPDGWELVSGQSVPSEVTLGADGAPSTVIKVQPQERSVAVKFVDDQSDERQVGQAITITGRDGGTVDLNLTVPDKYQLADGQQLPISYTFTKGSGDLTVHLKHGVHTESTNLQVVADIQQGLYYPWVDNWDGHEYLPFIGHASYGDMFTNGFSEDNGDIVFNIGSYDLSYKADSVTGEFIDWVGQSGITISSQVFKVPTNDVLLNGSVRRNRDLFDVLEFLDKHTSANAGTNWELQPILVDLSDTVGSSVGPEFSYRNKFPSYSLTRDNTGNIEVSLKSGEAKLNVDDINSFVMMGDTHVIVLPLTIGYTPVRVKNVHRIINVIKPDGKTETIDQQVKLTAQPKKDPTLSTSENFDKAYNVVFDNWSMSQWDQYTPPVVSGYTASQPVVAETTVTDQTNDQTVKITYTANPQTTTVVYQSADGTPVHTTTINGQTNQTVKIPNETPAGWTVVKGQVPGELTFGADGHDPIEVTVAHQYVTVTPDYPQDNGTKLPDNPAKTFNGVEANDLNKTITRTIKVATPDGQTKTVAQTAHLTRTADVDEVTGEVAYGNWTTGEWAAYDVPNVSGYTPSQSKVDKETVTAASNDTTTTITYTSNNHQISVEYVDDDAHGNVVKTDQVPGKTDQTITITPSAPTNYDLVDSNNRTYNVTSVDGQTVQIHVKHHQVTTSESKTVTRTINIDAPHDGTTVFKQAVDLSRDVTTDQVTGDKTYGDWSTTEWTHYDVPAVAGYTPSIKQVAQQVVDGTTEDQMVNVTYTANAQTTHVNYVDGNGNAVHTTTITGKTDQTVKVPSETPAGWKVVGEEVPTEITFGPDGHADVAVTVDHQHVTVTSDDPKTPADKLPNNPGKTYPDGVGHNDLNRTVTRTIKVVTPDGQTKMVTQTAKLTRTADVDEATGEVTYGDWTTDEWAAYDVPAVAGYTPSQSEVSATKVTDTTKNQTVTIGYTANNQTTHVNYVDGTGKTVHMTTITGKTDQTVKVPNETPAGWTIVGEPVPTELAFGPDGHADVTVTISHKHVTVISDQPKTSADKLPDNPGKTYPVGVGHDELNKTITRTIKITTPDGQTKTVEQTAKLTRTADVDEVTGEVIYGGWTIGEWSNYDVPAVPGYTPSQSEVPATKVTDDTKNQTVTVTYTANNQTTTIDYVDQNGKTVHTTVVNGHTDQTVKVPNEIPAGWTITNGQVPNEITFGPDGHADVTVTVGHQHVTVTPDKPQTDGTKLPDNPSQTFHGVAETDLNKTITRTIEVATPAGKTDTIKQTAKLTRTADVDEVTGEVTYGKWTTGAWSSYSVPTVPGYTPLQSVVAEAAVYADTTDQTVKITYTADSHTTHINYVDENGNVVHTTTVTGQTDQTVKVPNETPAGWTITTGQVPSEVTFGADGHTDVTVSIDHQTVTVTPDHPQADGTKLPDNPMLTFRGVDEGDLNKTVTRTIKLNVPGQDPQVITQTAHLTRTATVDEVTGEVTYGDWTSGQWDAYEVPAVDGYTASQTTIPAVKVTSETTSQDIVIDYVSVPTAQTTPSNNQTDENQVTSEKVATGTVQETKQDAIKNSAQSTMQDTKQLPQTGNDKQAGLLSLIGSSLMASLAIFGLGKKKKHEN